MIERKIQKAELNPNYIHHKAKLPYGLQVSEVIKGIEGTFSLLFEINNFLVSKGLERLEDLLLGNSLSGIVSEFLVKNISNNSKTMIRNEKVGGHPDLILRGQYTGNGILRGEDGIEVKASKQRGGWQGHNPEAIWLIVFRYDLEVDNTKPAYERNPITIIQVLAAELRESDWSFSGRSETSRRTITASITASGMDKLRSNPIYQNPEYIVGSTSQLREKYLSIPRK